MYKSECEMAVSDRTSVTESTCLTRDKGVDCPGHRVQIVRKEAGVHIQCHRCGGVPQG